VSVAIAEHTARDLTAELAEAGSRALLGALEQIARGSAVWTPQDPAGVTYAEKITKPDVELAPTLGVAESVRRVRASLPSAPSRVAIAGAGVTLIDACAGSAGLAPGEFRLGGTGPELGVSDGSLLVTRLKPDGKAEMEAGSWARGWRAATRGSWANT
jgi:methionyl-tRNA formyltransferase